jgi:hypothetical protein
MLELQGSPVASGKEALEKVAATVLPQAAAAALMDRITRARGDGALPPGTAGATFCEVADLAHLMWAQAEKL